MFLEEKLNPIKEVIIWEDRFSRRRKLRAFREQFLGKTDGGSSCKILNEDDIHLVYHPNAMTLSAYCNQPIIIRNDFLGYEIEYQIKEFKIQYYSEKTLDSHDIKFVTILGHISFTKDLYPGNTIIKKQRDRSYQTSPRNFFYHLANQTLTDTGFKIYLGKEREEKRISPDSCFLIRDTLSLKMVTLNPDFEFSNEDLGLNQTVYADIRILYKVWLRIVLLTDSFLIDQYGNTNLADKIILFWGYNQYRVGEMLPLDYQPSE